MKRRTRTWLIGFSSIEFNDDENYRLQVSIPVMKTNGFIPMEHLSDFPQLCRGLLTCYQPGDMIDESLLWQLKKEEVMLTLKASILHFAKDSRFPRSLDEIVVNSVFPCVSTRKQDFGVFVSLLCPPRSFDVLCPKTKMSSSLFESFSTGLKHQTIEGKVLNVDSAKKKVALSILKADSPQHPAETLDSYFQVILISLSYGKQCEIIENYSGTTCNVIFRIWIESARNGSTVRMRN